MKKVIIAALALIILSASIVPAFAETENSASTSAALMSMYLWRGNRLSEGLVLQPSVDVNYGKFNTNMWINYDADPDPNAYPDDSGVVTETDFTLAYTPPITGVDIKVGYIYYSALGSDTQEGFISVGKDLNPITPYVNVYYDFEEGTGAYIQVGLNYSQTLSSEMDLVAGAYASYLYDNNVVGTDANGEEYAGLHNAEISVSADYKKNDFTFTPMLAYTFPLSDDSKDSMTDADGDSSHLYAGVTAAVGF